jgi:hypothetical protein
VKPGGRTNVRHADVDASRGSGSEVAHGFKFLCGSGQGGLDRGDLPEPPLFLCLPEPVGEVRADLLQTRHLSWIDPEEGASDTGLTCPMFATTAEFLPQHHAQRQAALQIISAAEAVGHARVAEMNRQVAGNLDKIIATLEAEGPAGKEATASAS